MALKKTAGWLRDREKGTYPGYFMTTAELYEHITTQKQVIYITPPANCEWSTAEKILVSNVSNNIDPRDAEKGSNQLEKGW